MIEALAAATIFFVGFLISNFFSKRKIESLTRIYYNEKRQKDFEKKVKKISHHIDSAPVDSLLKPGEYKKD